MISFDVLSKDGRIINVVMSVFGFGGEKFSQLKQAIAAILFNHQAVDRDAKVHVGVRQNKIATYTFIGLLAFSMLAAFFQMEGEEYGGWWIKLSAIAVVFIIAILLWYFQRKPRVKSIDEVISRLN
jgi:cytosine/uracil/thiamine/allantoin permease